MSPQPPLKLCLVPLLGAPSHTFPLIDIARYFAFNSQQVTVLATPTNAKLIQKYLNDNTIPSEQQIIIQIIPMPLKEVGLPDDFDEVNHAGDIPTAIKVQRAISLLRHPVREFLEADQSDCIIVDSMYPWGVEIAAHLQIPCICFNPYGMFSLCVREALRSPESPHHHIESPEEPFVIPGLPFPVTMTKSELPAKEYLRFAEPTREHEAKSDMILANSFLELEKNNIDCFAEFTGVKVVTVGPASELHRKITGKFERGNKMINGENECLSWLNSKEPNSVLYINFGTVAKFPNEQLKEIASALQSSGHQFIWVVIGKENEKDLDEEKWLPKDFHENIQEKGLLVKGWAPQLSILDHPSIGGFMTHCGWNSVLESLSAGVPMITWPLTYEQFYNEKLVTQGVRVGVEIGVHEWAYWFNIGKKIMSREKIEEAIRKLMDGGERTEEMRKKAKEYRKMAKRAVEDNGSTVRAVTNLIEEVRNLKDVKKNSKTELKIAEETLERSAFNSKSIADLIDEAMKLKGVNFDKFQM